MSNTSALDQLDGAFAARSAAMIGSGGSSPGRAHIAALGGDFANNAAAASERSRIIRTSSGTNLGGVNPSTRLSPMLSSSRMPGHSAARPSPLIRGASGQRQGASKTSRLSDAVTSSGGALPARAPPSLPSRLGGHHRTARSSGPGAWDASSGPSSDYSPLARDRLDSGQGSAHWQGVGDSSPRSEPGASARAFARSGTGSTGAALRSAADLRRNMGLTDRMLARARAIERAGAGTGSPVGTGTGTGVLRPARRDRSQSGVLSSRLGGTSDGPGSSISNGRGTHRQVRSMQAPAGGSGRGRAGTDPGLGAVLGVGAGVDRGMDASAEALGMSLHPNPDYGRGGYLDDRGASDHHDHEEDPFE